MGQAEAELAEDFEFQKCQQVIGATRCEDFDSNGINRHQAQAEMAGNYNNNGRL